jgi:hypothetical protein
MAGQPPGTLSLGQAYFLSRGLEQVLSWTQSSSLDCGVALETSNSIADMRICCTCILDCKLPLRANLAFRGHLAQPSSFCRQSLQDTPASRHGRPVQSGRLALWWAAIVAPARVQRRLCARPHSVPAVLGHLSQRWATRPPELRGGARGERHSCHWGPPMAASVSRHPIGAVRLLSVHARAHLYRICAGVTDASLTITYDNMPTHTRGPSNR